MPESLTPLQEARARVLAAAAPLDAEDVPVAEALDRVLAADLRAAADVPPFANSAMDGFAVHPGPAGRRLRIAGESRAGAPFTEAVAPHDAVRISTGAALPQGVAAVIPIEQVRERGAEVELDAEVSAGDHVRAAGEDMRAGTTVLAAGAELGPAELGAAVAAGAATLRCARAPRGSILCTGDELRAPGEPLGPGEIHNSNAAALVALARRAGAAVAGSEIVRDTPQDTAGKLRAALRSSDVVVVSGGISVGPHDLVKAELERLGVRQAFWRIALKPGKPTWFGTGEHGQLVFGLPGNPVSALVTFVLLAAPALRALQGAPPSTPGAAVLGEPIARAARRDQAIRVRLQDRDGGPPAAFPTGPQGSHMLTSMLGADGLALVPAGSGELPAGERVALERL